MCANVRFGLPEANVHSTFPLDFVVWSMALDVKDTKKSR